MVLQLMKANQVSSYAIEAFRMASMIWGKHFLKCQEVLGGIPPNFIDVPCGETRYLTQLDCVITPPLWPDWCVGTKMESVMTQGNNESSMAQSKVKCGNHQPPKIHYIYIYNQLLFPIPKKSAPFSPVGSPPDPGAGRYLPAEVVDVRSSRVAVRRSVPALRPCPWGCLSAGKDLNTSIILPVS